MQKLSPDKALELVKRQHQEYVENHYLWKRLQDGLIGGDAYRKAEYGTDPRDSTRPVMNLIRHAKEYPAPPSPTEPGAILDLYSQGADSYERAAEDSYKLRLARTPVPQYMAGGIAKHLSRIYDRPIHREVPEPLLGWSKDVDGRGTTIGDWMTEEAAEMFLALGQIDLAFDHPAAPKGTQVRSAADAKSLGLDRCIVTIILPENLPWWIADESRPGWYRECIVKEHSYTDEGKKVCLYRHWDSEGSITYNAQGEAVGDVVPHPYRAVPIRRFFDRRRPRTCNVGLSRYEAVSELEREYYNEDSELILANSQQAHPTLQGPEDAFRSDGTLKVGPDYVIHKIRTADGGYEGFDYIDPPKGAAEFIRSTKGDLVDRMDRAMCLTKPAGSVTSAGSGAGTVSQSGISKELDQRDGNALLGKLAGSLRKLEVNVFEMANLILTDGQWAAAEQLGVEITYPRGFNLLSADEMAKLGADIQTFVDAAGAMPEFETALLQAMQRESLPGLDPERLERIEEEAEAVIEAKAAAYTQRAENPPPEGDPMPSPMGGEMTAEPTDTLEPADDGSALPQDDLTGD